MALARFSVVWAVVNLLNLFFFSMLTQCIQFKSYIKCLAFTEISDESSGLFRTSKIRGIRAQVAKRQVSSMLFTT